jgi:hypothetical protein
MVRLETELIAFKKLMKERDKHYKEALTLATNQSKALWSYLIAIASMAIAALAIYWRHL